jgi:hypothetical protein
VTGGARRRVCLLFDCGVVQATNVSSTGVAAVVKNVYEKGTQTEETAVGPPSPMHVRRRSTMPSEDFSSSPHCTNRRAPVPPLTRGVTLPSTALSLSASPSPVDSPPHALLLHVVTRVCGHFCMCVRVCLCVCVSVCMVSRSVSAGLSRRHS